MSIARRDTLKKLAAKAATDAAEGRIVSNSAYELMLNQLAQHRRRLKQIKSSQAKEAIKRDEILPQLKPYVDGVIEAATGQQDDVLIYYMIWAFDAGGVDECLRVAEYAAEKQLVMPDVFSRDLADWLAEEIAIRTIKSHEKGDALDNSSHSAWALVKEADLMDEVAAKLHKAMGLTLHASEPRQALHHYKTAVELWDRVGVKKLIAELEKTVSAQ